MTELVDIAFAPLGADRAYRSVAQLIETRILAGEWPVRSGLPAETAIADRLGVNRSTVREAIRVLEQNGLVGRREGGKRLYVTAPVPSDLAGRFSAAMVLGEVSFFELWESMRCLEPALARGAAERITEAEIEELADNLERTRLALSDSRCLAALDIEFHDLVAAASRNRALRLCREPISALFYPAFSRLLSHLDAGERLLFAHGRILERLQERDGEGARAWMDKHVVDFKRGYELAKLDLARPVTWPDPSSSP